MIHNVTGSGLPYLYIVAPFFVDYATRIFYFLIVIIFSFFKKVSVIFGFSVFLGFFCVCRCSALDCCWAVRLAFRYLFPRMELHFLQLPHRFSRSSVPPLSTSMRWSASVLGALWHQWQMGSFSSTMRRLCMNSGLFRLVIVFLCCGYVTSALGYACGCFRVCDGLWCVCPPHFTAVCCWLSELFRVEHHSPFV